MGAAPPWGQSLLRSCLASHSFPPPPPAYVLPALGTLLMPIRRGPKCPDSAKSTVSFELGRYRAVRKVGSTNRAKPHQAGVGAGRSAQRGTSAATTGPRGP